MVIGEINNKEIQRSSSYKLAHIHDRMAAFVMDFAIVLFSHSILSFYIKKNQRLALIEGFQASFFFWLLLNLTLFLLMYFSYNFFSLKYFHNTLGKKVFRIQTLDLWTLKPLNHQQAFRYSFYKLAGFISFLTSYMGAFCDEKRRCFHEKLSDSICVTFKNHYSEKPLPKERHFFNGFLLPFKILIFMCLAYFYLGFYSLIKKEELNAVLNIPLYPTCEKLSSLKERVKSENRLEVALSFYFLGQIDRECLEREARASFEKNLNLELANFAYAYAKPLSSRLYMSKACDLGMTLSCNLFENKDNDKEKYSLSEAYEVLAVSDYLFSRSRYKDSLSLLAQLNSTEWASWLSHMQIKNYWRMGLSENLHFAINTFKNNMYDKDYFKTVSWICSDSLSSSCEQSPSYCKDLLVQKDMKETSIEEQLALVRLRECKKDWSALPRGLRQSVSDLFQAKKLYAKERKEDGFIDILKSERQPYEVRNEVAKHYLQQNANIDSSLKAYLKSFKQLNEQTDLNLSRSPASED